MKSGQISLDSARRSIRGRAKTALAYFVLIRPYMLGVSTFVMTMDKNYGAAPRKSKVDLFQIDWNGLTFIVVVVPNSVVPEAVEVMKKVGLEGTVPDLPPGGLPITGPNVRLVSYVPGHFALAPKSDTAMMVALQIEQAALGQSTKIALPAVSPPIKRG